MTLALFYVWDDARVWAHWNHAFDTHLSCLGPVSCSFQSWVPSECASRGGCHTSVAATSFIYWYGRQHFSFTVPYNIVLADSQSYRQWLGGASGNKPIALPLFFLPDSWTQCLMVEKPSCHHEDGRNILRMENWGTRRNTGPWWLLWVAAAAWNAFQLLGFCGNSTWLPSRPLSLFSAISNLSSSHLHGSPQVVTHRNGLGRLRVPPKWREAPGGEEAGVEEDCNFREKNLHPLASSARISG